MKRNNRPEGLARFLADMRDREEQCTSVIKPFNVNTMEVTVTKVKKHSFESLLCDYFRLILSSEPQKAIMRGTGRSSQWLFSDRTSGAFLGFAFMCDMNVPDTDIDEWFKRQIGGHTHRSGSRADAARTSMHLQQFRRCLPLWDFGPLTGGKLMTLAMTSTEVIQSLETQYSFDLAVLIIKALKGRSSQYNRLHTNGILECPALTRPDRVAYYVPLRKNWYEFIRGDTEDPGPRLTLPFAERVNFWRNRWLPNKIHLTDDGWVRPDPKRYLLGPVFKEKLAALIKKEEESEDE